MEQSKIDRINELARISKERNLTPKEKEEQQKLRKEFLANIRREVRSQLESIEFVD